MSRPRASVLLAAFRPDHLGAAIESVLGQELGDFELLVLDDSPDDGVRELVRGFDDERITLLPSRPGGFGVARNHDRGLQVARADLIAIINHDDVWEPQLLALLVGALDEEPDAVVAFADHHVIDEQGQLDPLASDENSKRWKRSTLAAGVHRPFRRLAAVDQSLPMAQCAVWRRAAVPAIPPWAGDRYDYWLGITLASTGRGAVYVPQRLARFRIHAGNLGRHRSLARRLQLVNFERHLATEPGLTEVRDHLRSRRRRALVDLAKWPVEVLMHPGSRPRVR